jgi:type II secretory pathway component PulC
MPAIPDKQAVLGVLRRVLGLANVLLLVVFCGCLAKWTWHFVGPDGKPPLPPPDISKQAAQLQGQMAGIFFASEDGDANQQAEEPLNVTLVGVFSGPKGFAVVRANDRMEAVVVGDEIVPGAVLAGIKPRAIEVERDGQTQEIALAAASGGGAAAPAANADTAAVDPTTGATGEVQDPSVSTDATASAATGPAATGPVGLATVHIGHTRVFFTSRELAAAVQKLSPQALFGPVQEDKRGGWQLRHVMPDSPAYWIGLRSRDVLTAIDGAPIQDASQIYALQQKLQQTGKFEIAGRRAGKPLTLVYTTEE